MMFDSDKSTIGSHPTVLRHLFQLGYAQLVVEQAIRTLYNNKEDVDTTLINVLRQAKILPSSEVKLSKNHWVKIMWAIRAVYQNLDE